MLPEPEADGTPGGALEAMALGSKLVPVAGLRVALAEPSAQANPAIMTACQTSRRQWSAISAFTAIFISRREKIPWLETVETEDSAAPYHDWNERITAECYAPNGASRIVNGENQIIRIMNNYSRISFNFGPTLLSWLEENAPRTVSHDPRCRSAKHATLRRARIGTGAGL